MVGVVRTVFTGVDRLAGHLAVAGATAAQIALVCLGVHLAADRMDDDIAAGITHLQGRMDVWLTEPLGGAAEAVGLPYDTLLVWDLLPTAPIAAWSALAVELSAITLLSVGFLLTTRRPELSWTSFKEALCVHALVMPLALAGVLVAGSWSLAMAVEDLLPPSDVAIWAARLVGAAALVRFGWGAWSRSVGSMEPPRRRTAGLASALILVPVGLLAWMHGAPIWGWLV